MPSAAGAGGLVGRYENVDVGPERGVGKRGDGGAAANEGAILQRTPTSADPMKNRRRACRMTRS